MTFHPHPASPVKEEEFRSEQHHRRSVFMAERAYTGYKDESEGMSELSMEKVGKSNAKSDFVRVALLVLGTLFLATGTVGIFLPLLPTTPFFLLAAACYARSSKRFYHWLLYNRVFGSYIRNYREGKGIALRVKVLTLALLWGTIIYSAFFVVDDIYWQIILLVIAVGVTIHIFKTRTLRQ
jgi:uncharacterized membrane protein YbaN (DUF454 family)